MSDPAELLAPLLAMAAVLVTGAPRRRSLHRLKNLRRGHHPPTGEAGSVARGGAAPRGVTPGGAARGGAARGGATRANAGSPSRAVLFAGAVAMPVLWLAVGLPAAVVSAVAVGLLTARQRRRGRRPIVGVSEAALFIELLAAYLAAGATTPQALRQAGSTSTGLAGITAGVANALSAGLPPDEAWSAAASEPALAGMARICARSAVTGSGCADELARLAARMRHRHQQAIERRAARAGIWLVLPLGSCFLPAFVLLTVVPVVAGLLPTLG